MLYIMNGSSKLPIDGIFRVIEQKDENEDINDFDKESLAVPINKAESFKQIEMDSRLAILAEKFSIGKKVIKDIKKKEKKNRIKNSTLKIQTS